MCENVCKKIQLQQRVEKLKSSLEKKRAELNNVNKQQEALIQSLYKKVSLGSFTSPTISNSSTSSSLTSSCISESHLLYSPVTANNTQQEFSNLLIKNSTPNELKNSLIIPPASDYFTSRYRSWS